MIINYIMRERREAAPATKSDASEFQVLFRFRDCGRDLILVFVFFLFFSLCVSAGGNGNECGVCVSVCVCKVCDL